MTTAKTAPKPSPRLLETIMGDEVLRQRLAEMPLDEKTLELSIVGATHFSHPNFASKAMVKNGGDSAAPSETLTLETPKTGNSRTDPTVKLAPLSGFVPKRRVASLSRTASDDPDYRLIGELGSGGTGIVFQAHQRAVDREVAVKMLRGELAVNSQSRQRFLTEARVIGGLDHPNVIALHEVYLDESDNLYYSMKRIDGTSWDKQIGEMTFQQNLETLLGVADGIRYAHSRGLIHRDIKPENVMLGRFGEVLLADWGLAVNDGTEFRSESLYQSIGGTPAYMAPELASGCHADITFQSDIYLLGATLFQILTGVPPHDGRTLLECIQNASDNVIREHQVEGELMDIAMRAMATSPSDRYESVAAFIDAIKANRQHEQSNLLTERARKRVCSSDGSEPYEDFRIADALLAEAIDVWPENSRAIATKHEFQRRFAEVAAARGDLDLAATLYEALGESDSQAAHQVAARRQRRSVNHQKVSRYSALFTQSPDPGLLIELNSSKIVEANHAFASLFGFQSGEVVGKPIDQLNLWKCPSRREEFVELLKQHGEVDNFEAVFLSRDGRSIDALINSRTTKVQNEEMIVSTIRDISLRKQAERELEKSRKQLCDMQRLAGLATWSFDVATGRVTWSAETFRLVGREQEAGTPSKDEYIEMIHPDDRERLRSAIHTALKSGAAYEIKIRQQTAGGQYQTVLVRGQPIFDKQGNTVEVYGVLIPKGVGVFSSEA